MDSQTVNYYRENAAQIAKRYDEIVSSLSQHFENAFSPHSKLLDIGCGSGRDLSILHTLGHDCYGIDPTPEFVTLAQQAHPALLGRIANGCLPALSPPFRGEFDGVLCSAVLMHIAVEDLESSANAIKNCLKIGGRLLYSVPTKRLDVVAGDRDANGRLFIPNQSQRLLAIFESIGFVELKTWANADSFGRDAVEWESVLLERKT
jgi:2-polyprenyl-3-methyl-5-hydroxy-6-metoxy-1,4-benzoquinol methylase